MKAARIAGICLFLAGIALAEASTSTWSMSRVATQGSLWDAARSSFALAQRQSPARGSRHNRAWFRSTRNRSGIMGAQVCGARPADQFMVDTAINYGSASTQQCNPSVAFDGSNYLVAWTDYLDTLFNVGVRAARVTPEGALLDPEGIMIDSLDGLDPVIGFDGTNYLVVNWGWDIHGFRVSPTGEVLDSMAIVISSSGGWQKALAFDGTNYLVVWEDYRDSVSQVYGARVTPAGAVLDTAGIAIGVGPHRLACPAVTFDGTNFLVVWEACDSANPYVGGTRVSPAGQVLDSAFVVDSASQLDDWYGPTATSDGTNSLVVWHDFTLGMRAALVASDGSVVDSGITIAPADVGYAGHAALYDGTDFLVTWKAWSPVDGILASRVSRAGVPLDTPGMYVSAPAHAFTDNPAVAFDGNRYFVAWDDDRTYCPNIYGARLTRQLDMLDTTGLGISRGVNAQRWPAAAFDGTNYLVTWTDNRNMTGAIYGARVSSTGANLDPAGIPICTLGFRRDYSAVAFDGMNYLVAWSDGRRNDSADIYAARVTPDGNVLDPQGIPIAVGGETHMLPAVAFNSSNYLVVWNDINDQFMGTIRCARVSPDGQVLDSAGISICTAPEACLPVVASDGEDWLTAWYDWRSGDSPGVYAARVTAAGQVLDSGGFVVADAEDGEGLPALASDGTNYLAVWERVNGSALDLRGALISQDAILLDSFMVRPQAAPMGCPSSAVFDGTNYGVAWLDSPPGSDWAIYGARISPSGSILDMSVVASPVIMTMDVPVIGLACGAGSQSLCAYPSFTDYWQGREYKTTRIWGRIGALGGIQEQAGAPVSRPEGTIVRGVLWLPKATDCESQPACLLDISGRKVLDLRPGANDVSRLAPGVYFVREARAQAQAQAGSRPQVVRKIVLTK